MFQSIRKRIKNRFVTKIIFVCMLTATLLILFQSVVTTVYVTKYQQEQAVDSGLQTLNIANAYFTDLYTKVKSFNKMLYEEETARRQLSSFFHDGEMLTAAKRLSLRRVLNEQLVKVFGSDYGALVEANYYDIAGEQIISFYWNEAAQGRKGYIEPVIADALENLNRSPSARRMYELAILTEDASESTLSLYDFVRDPDNLTEVKGILIFHYAIDKMTQEFYTSGFSDEMEVVMLSQSGTLCYDSLHRFAEAATRFDGKTLLPGTYMDNGVSIIQNNNRFGFWVISTISRSALYHTVYRMLVFTVMCTIVVLGLLLFLLLGYDRKFSRRMTQLVEEISRIEAGRLDVVLPESDNQDEVDLFTHHLNEMQRRLSEQIACEKESLKKIWELELMQKDAEFYALQAQIKPHFLFNTLEIIRMRAVAENAPDTAAMVTLLADLLRQKMDRTALTTFQEEMDYCDKYIELFSYRFEGELFYELQMDPRIRRYYLPVYLLQPVIENALIHGFAGAVKEPHLTVCIRQEKEQVEIRIIDNGSGIDRDTLLHLQQKLKDNLPAGKSIGILNVHNRLQMLFGEAYGAQIDSRLGEGTTVTLHIPVMVSAKEWRTYVQSSDR